MQFKNIGRIAFSLIVIGLAGCSSINSSSINSSSLPSEYGTFGYNISLQEQEVEMRNTLAPIMKLLSGKDLLVRGTSRGGEFTVWDFRIANTEYRLGQRAENIPRYVQTFCKNVSMSACTEGVAVYHRPSKGEGYRTISMKKMNSLTFLKSSSESEFQAFKKDYYYPDAFQGGIIFNSYIPWMAMKEDLIRLSKFAVKINSAYEGRVAEIKATNPELISYIPKISISSEKFGDKDGGFEQLYSTIERDSLYFIHNSMSIAVIKGFRNIMFRHKNYEQEDRRLADEKRAARSRKLKEDKAWYDLVIKSEKDTWSKRYIANLDIGDKVCTYSNRMGFVEKKNGNSIKVLIKGKLSDSEGYSSGHFFGNKSYYQSQNETMQYNKLDSMEWFQQNEIASCGFSL